MNVIFVIFSFLCVVNGQTFEVCGTNATSCKTLTCLNEYCMYTICNEQRASFGCQLGSVISIIDVFFGRKSAITCPDRNTAVNNCIPNDTLHQHQMEKGMRICNNETHCNLKASTVFSDACGVNVWEEPCSGVTKYLKVNYTCVKKESLNYWSSWSSWTLCSTSLVIRYRNKSCINPPYKQCTKSTCKGRFLPNNITESQNCVKVYPSSTANIQPTSVNTIALTKVVTTSTISPVRESSVAPFVASTTSPLCTIVSIAGTNRLAKVYMKLHLRITWKLFCCSLDVFKKRIATLVDDIKELHHVYIANLQQCNSTHSADAFVHLFIESQPNKVDETLTRKVQGKMEEILKGNDTSEVGKYFKDLIRDIKLIEVNEKNETKKIWKTWKIVIIVAVSIAFVICLAIFILWIKSRGNRIRPIKKNTNNTILLK